jgi:hypothetical protein
MRKVCHHALVESSPFSSGAFITTYVFSATTYLLFKRGAIIILLKIRKIFHHALIKID